MKGINRLPFSVASHEFDLSNHRPFVLLADTKELMPTVIRLAKLMSYAAPAQLPTIALGELQEILDAITAFLNFVNNHHFPLDLLHLEIEEEVWDYQPYHPWLSEIRARPVGFAAHDIEPHNYGDLVELITRLGQVHKIGTAFSHENKLVEKYPEWSDDHEKFRFGPVIPILEEMNLPKPIDGLPSLIKMVQHETDTFYLDACPICGSFQGPEFEWTAPNFKWFSQDWQKAKPIYTESKKLIQWSNGKQKRLRTVSAILKKAHSIYMFYKDDTCPEWF